MFSSGFHINNVSVLLSFCVSGVQFHRCIRQLEFDITIYIKRKRFKKAKSTRLRIECMWYPLREIQAENMARSIATAKEEANQRYYQCEMQYLEYRKQLREARSNIAPSMRTSRGDSRLVCDYTHMNRILLLLLFPL